MFFDVPAMWDRRSFQSFSAKVSMTKINVSLQSIFILFLLCFVKDFKSVLSIWQVESFSNWFSKFGIMLYCNITVPSYYLAHFVFVLYDIFVFNLLFSFVSQAVYAFVWFAIHWYYLRFLLVINGRTVTYLCHFCSDGGWSHWQTYNIIFYYVL